MAYSSFKKFEKAIIDAYDILDNNKDRDTFEDYLKTNVLLWRDRFEEVLSSNLPEPTTPEYEKEKEQGPTEEPVLEIIDINI